MPAPITRYRVPGLYLWSGMALLACSGLTFWFALIWPLYWIAAGLFLASAILVLYLASRPAVEIYEGHVKIGNQAIPWRQIRRLDRSANMPLMVRLTLADKTRILVVYPGDPNSSSGLLRSLRRDPPPDVQVARLLSLCCADPSRVPARTVAQHVEMERRRAEFPDRRQALNNAMRSVVHMIGKGRGEAYRTIVDYADCPVLLLQGDRDRLVPVSVARSAARAHPDWTLAVLPGVGHVPQLEVPRETAQLIIDWLGPDGRPGADLADSGAPAGSAMRATLTTARGAVKFAANRRRKSVRFRD